ncbi:putative FF domain superfamily protein [Helianthus annuus]|nr:putative FF domain superfamily protein [Helianthus annuus]
MLNELELEPGRARARLGSITPLTNAKPKLEKDPQGRAANPYLDQSDLEKLFREHTKLLHDRCANEYKALLAEVITTDAATKEYEDGKTVFTSWSTARHLLKDDTRYNKMPRKDREPLWRRHVEDLQRRRKSTVDQDMEKHGIREAMIADSFIWGCMSVDILSAS